MKVILWLLSFLLASAIYAKQIKQIGIQENQQEKPIVQKTENEAFDQELNYQFEHASSFVLKNQSIGNKRYQHAHKHRKHNKHHSRQKNFIQNHQELSNDDIQPLIYNEIDVSEDYQQQYADMQSVNGLTNTELDSSSQFKMYNEIDVSVDPDMQVEDESSISDHELQNWISSDRDEENIENSSQEVALETFSQIENNEQQYTQSSSHESQYSVGDIASENQSYNMAADDERIQQQNSDENQTFTNQSMQNWFFTLNSDPPETNYEFPISEDNYADFPQAQQEKIIIERYRESDEEATIIDQTSQLYYENLPVPEVQYEEIMNDDKGENKRLRSFK